MDVAQMCQSTWVGDADVAVVGKIVRVEQYQIHSVGLLVTEQAQCAYQYSKVACMGAWCRHNTSNGNKNPYRV
ncbi:hypothetical protein HSBAA_43610 [Vreelandella sulfidaeris]|uniref:Uncharacterized protein n=1 Tax=Vreelandella sulfidaeris TaxID=115553 RepID=A0A455UAL6_9GAMM|nr:hypothetical protein HSBAA_43610 [Halomonas sulfidaeris]